MLTEATAVLTVVKEMDDVLGIIGKYVANLKGQPDLAAIKLAQALDEVRKTWEAVDAAITSYLALGIDKNALKKGSRTLLQLGGGGLLVEVEKGAGSCSIIRDIYDKYLDRWFDEVFTKKSTERAVLHGVFIKLAQADDGVFDKLKKVGEELQTEAIVVLDLVLARRENEAKTRVLSSLKALMSLQQALSKTLRELLKLKTSLIKIAKAV